MRDLVVIGAGGMATNIVDQFNLEQQVIQYYDVPREVGETKDGIPVQLEFKIDPDHCSFISIIGDTRRKRELIEGLGFFKPVNFINLVARGGCEIVKSARWGVGNIIQPPSSLLARVKIGNHNLICGGARIGHDTVVGDYCTFGAEVMICGNCDIRDGAFIGANATIRPGVTVGEGAVVGCGTVVIRDVPLNHEVVGNPAQDLKTVEKWR